MIEENVITVLMYLFKNHLQEDGKLNITDKKIHSNLSQAGFRKSVINRAIKWINNLTDENFVGPVSLHEKSIRIYADEELQYLNADCRGFLLTLEQKGILSPTVRELVINQAIALAIDEIDMNLLTWVTLLVLFSQPNHKNALACLEYLVLGDEVFGGVH